jgi:hypothetical protein
MHLVVNAEFWLAGLLLVISQVYRSSALKSLVSEVHVYRLRDVIALNSVSSLLNVLGPARIGDILRIVFLARKGLGSKFAFFAVFIERLFDLVVVLLFAILLIDIRSFSVIILFAALSALLSSVLFLVRYSLPARYDFLLLNQLKHFISIKELGKYFGKLAISWLCALGAVAILNIKNEGFLVTWINWNVSLGEPFTPLISRNQFLLGILLLPILALLISTIVFRNSTQTAFNSLKKVATETDLEIEKFMKLNSNFSGSGCDIFSASFIGRGLVEDLGLSLICKVEPKSRHFFLQTQADFIQNNEGLFDFPRVYRVERTANYNVIVMENIQDFSTGSQSENYAKIIGGKSQEKAKPYLEEIVNFLIESKLHLTNKQVKPNIDSLVSRVDRVAAFCAVQRTYSSRSRIHDKNFESTLKEISRLLRKEFDSDIEVPSHGDATLSNFLRQETRSGFRIRSIDPNPRIKVGRIEYDLGKIYQSVGSMYEDTMQNPELIAAGVTGFASRKSVNLLESHLLDVIQSSAREININLIHLFHLTHLIRILPYQFKKGPSFVEYWEDVIVYQFESMLKK